MIWTKLEREDLPDDPLKVDPGNKPKLVVFSVYPKIYSGARQKHWSYGRAHKSTYMQGIRKENLKQGGSALRLTKKS